MRLVLHLGQVKAGSTALQQGLNAAAPGVRRAGVLYPSIGRGAVAHHALLPLCEDPHRLPPWMLADAGGAEAAATQAWRVWGRICDRVQADRPKVLVLSSEFLLQHSGGPAKRRLAAILSELEAAIVPVVYIRDPVAQFRARLQEWLKVENRPLPAPPPLRAALEDCEASFPGPPQLVPYDRRSLTAGDILADFVGRFLADHLDPAALPKIEANPGLSAEALVLMARLRAEAGATDAVARRVARLIAPLAALDRADPPARPLTLRPEVAEAVLRAATCHRWLAETGRLSLPDLDLARIDGTALPDWLLSAAPESLFPHDAARLSRLRNALRRSDPDLLHP